MEKLAVCFLTFFAINTALGQVAPSEDLILYELNQAQRKYTLYVNFDSPEEGENSIIVIGDTFAVQPRVTPHGTMCDVFMSNASVLHTKISRSPTNEVVQMKMWFDKYFISFPEHTKIAFNNSVVELSKFKLRAPSQTNMIIYEGVDALREMKKLGLEPPPDMDMEKAVGHQTRKVP